MQTASLMLAVLSTGPGKTLSAMLLPPYWIFERDAMQQSSLQCMPTALQCEKIK
jgi:hypothetical protein